MKAENQGKRTSRWVEFLSEIFTEDENGNLEPTRSPPSMVADDVEQIMNSDEIGKNNISSDALETPIAQLPTNFDSLTALVTSNLVHLEKLMNLHNQTQTDSHNKSKENIPISSCLVQSEMTSLNPMDIEQTENLNHPIYS